MCITIVDCVSRDASCVVPLFCNSECGRLVVLFADVTQQSLFFLCSVTTVSRVAT